MPHVSNPHSQVNRHGQMNKRDLKQEVVDRPRDKLRGAYGGDKNKGRDKSRRINEKSDRTPIR